MSTLVCFHAHPDDESITTGGTMARASAEGHRVVLVVATGGEHGESPDDLAETETLRDRRLLEAEASARALGVHRVVWLGYQDSGMTGWPQNDDPASFCRADLDEAASRLAAVLRDEKADTLTTYDWPGNYGHPDHIQIHRVGARAAEMVDSVEVFQATLNRDFVLQMMAAARDGAALTEDFDVNETDDGNPMGMAQSELTTFVDVSGFLDSKRASIMCHASQATDTGFFLQMPPEMFAQAFGTEWFIHVGRPTGSNETWIFGS